MWGRAFLFIALGLGAVATAAGSTWVVPRAVETTSANGAGYSTEIEILNRGTDAANVQVQFIPSSAMTMPAPAPVIESVAAGQTLVLLHVLKTLWGLSGTFGGIQITSDHVLLVNARTYNNNSPAPGGYGYAETAAATTDLPDAGQARQAIWVSQSADPSKGFNSIAGAVLLTPDATVNINLYDGSDNAIGNAQLTGGVGAQEIALGTLATADLPVARVEFDVVSGLAAPYVLVTDNVTGDPMSVPPLPFINTATNAFFTGIVKATAGQTQTWRSDLRLLSTYPAAEIAVQVTVVASSLAGLAGSTQTIDLFPGQILEIQDVLGSLFSAPDGTTATLQFQSAFGVVMFARTAYVYNDGTPGSFGYLQAGNATGSFLTQGQTAALIGLRQDTTAPGAVTTIGAASGQDGFIADLVLSDASGNQLATIPSGLVLLPSTTSEVLIGTLFPSVPIPEDAHVDILPDSGEALVYAKNSNLVTNDVDQTPANVLTPYYCPAPSVILFSASPEILSAAGPVEVDWYTTGGGAVQIDQGIGGGGAFGKATLNLTGSTTFNLTAQNSCGTATATLSVPVGGPVVTGIVPANPMPGQIVTLSLNNAANINSAQGALLACGNSTTQYVPLTVDSSGNITFVVPFVQDTTFPAGYWQGACSLSAQADSGQSAPFAFTIAALTFVADPAAAFQTLVANLQQQAHTQFAAQAGVEPFDQVASLLDPMIDNWAALLNKMAGDVKANGTATMPLGIAMPSSPAPPTVTVTLKDLTNLVALLNTGAPNLFQTQFFSLHPRGLTPGAPSSYHDDASTSCLIRDPQIGPAYNVCVNQMDAAPLVSLFIEGDSAVSSALGGGCNFNASFASIVANILWMASAPAFTCNVLPVTLSGFSPAPPTVPLGTLEQTGNGGTKISVSLTKNWDPASNPLASEILSGFFQHLYSVASRNQCDSSAVAQINSLQQQFTDAITSEIGTLLSTTSAKYPSQVTSTVYKCDLSTVTPQDLSALNHRIDREDNTIPPYYFEGRRTGSTSLIVIPYLGNFITTSPEGFDSPGIGSPAYYVPLTVTGGPTLSIGSQLAAVYDETKKKIPVAIQFMRPVAVGGQVCISAESAGNEGEVPPTSTCGLTSSPPSAFVAIDPQGGNTWKVTVQVSGSFPNMGLAQIDLLASNPPQFGTTSHIQINGTLGLATDCSANAPNCIFPDGVMTIDDRHSNVQTVSLYSGDKAPNPSFTVDSSDSGRNPVDIYVGIMANGGEAGPSPNFYVTFTIQYLNQ
jgi:hypothetical protein